MKYWWPVEILLRVRCLIGCALVDDVEYYNRVHEMMYILSTKHNHDSDDVESSAIVGAAKIATHIKI